MSLISKKELRKEILALRDALSQKMRQEKSVQIANQVIGLKEFQEANKVLLYVHMRSEVETTGICDEAKAQGKEIYYPRVIGDEMKFYRIGETTEFETSAFGVIEPKMDIEKQLVVKKADGLFVLMPGVVFDKEGSRIGYGGGYYDKYLHYLEKTMNVPCICKVAVAFGCQIIDRGKIQRETHDVCPDYIITEDNVYTVGKE